MISIHNHQSGKINAMSGAVIDYINPERSQFEVIDIASGLSNDCRFGGQLKNFYSVAQHSVLVMALAPAHLALAALFHDASEAYMRDVPKPLKNLLPQYERIEERMMFAILEKFQIKFQDIVEIKEYDKQALEIENEAFRLNRPTMFNVIMNGLEYKAEAWSPRDSFINWTTEVEKRLEGGLAI